MKTYDWTAPVCHQCFARGHEQKDCKMTKEELRSIDTIAAFIGARLHYPNPLVNGQGNPWVSTISVD